MDGLYGIFVFIHTTAIIMESRKVIKKTVVRGDVFIIPIMCNRFKTFPPDIREWIKEKHSRLTGIEPKDEDIMLQVLITSEECENWNDHQGGFQKVLGLPTTTKWEDSKEGRLLGYFPSYYPASIFAEKKEGDEVTLNCPEYGVQIVLTCHQSGYRYSMFGTFEVVFRKVV